MGHLKAADERAMADPENLAIHEPNESIAMDWFVRLRGGGSVREHADFDRWLEADPANQGAYKNVEAMWERLHGAGELLLREEDRELRALLASMDANREVARRHTARASVTAVICLLLLASAVWLKRPHLLEDLRADDVTARGEQRTVTFPDGSTALMDADSAIAFKFTAGDRRVILLRGAAFFSVVHTGKPFEVEAAGGEERVLGTRFAVRIEDDGASVTVSEGKVAVSLAGFVSATLTAGEHVAYGPSGISRIVAVNLEKAMAWERGLLIFYNTPMNSVVEELGHYYRGRILILNDELSRQPVTGNFRTDDPEAALVSLQKVVGFKRYDILGGLTILR
jgi:transmembrane sensor